MNPIMAMLMAAMQHSQNTGQPNYIMTILSNLLKQGGLSNMGMPKAYSPTLPGSFPTNPSSNVNQDIQMPNPQDAAMNTNQFGDVTGPAEPAQPTLSPELINFLGMTGNGMT